ncbi:transcription termination/antitermination protein NusA [Patescibacteria group bacterium]|nr:transcription termination/antitermination protein NusA [Patescibacteria group bacterium]
MLDLKTIHSVLGEFEDRGITREIMIEAIESAMATAYKREYGKRGQIVRAMLDMNTGTVSFEQVKTIVDDTMVRFPTPDEEEVEMHHHEHEETLEGELPRFDTEKHILIEDARRIKRDAELGGELVFPLEPQDDFGRIAAQTAKQVIIQKIREAEKLSVLDEFGTKKNEIVSGIVQRMERGAIFIDLGRATGIIPYEEQIPSERFRAGERIQAYLYSVDEGFRGVYLRLSRSHPRFLVKLFEMEVPELASGALEVKGIAREPGSRTKIAIASLDPHVDPVGSLVGQRGVRVSTVMAALGGERIDIIEWSEDQSAFIKESLSPASVLEVKLDEENHRATVTVTEDQQSLAIGRGGQNVRLAAKLTGWNIDIISMGGQNVAESDGEGVSIKDESSKSEKSMSTKNPVEPTADDESIDEGAVEMAQAMSDTSVEDDQPQVEGVEGITEQNMMVAEEDPETSTLVAEEETNFTDNGPVADAEESRDETSASIRDGS